MLALCLRLSSAGSELELCCFAARQQSNFHIFIVTRSCFRPGLKPEELKLVWNAYLAFERSRMHVLRSLDVQYRMQSSVSHILCFLLSPQLQFHHLSQVIDGDAALVDVSFIQRVDL
jgi:hypothetical protein